MNLRENIIRPAPAILAGILVAHVVFFLAGFAAEWLFPTPPELLDPQTPEDTAARVDAANAVGLAGGAMTGRAAGRHAIVAAIVLGALLSLWGVYSFYVFYPARLWFPIGLFLCFPLFSVLWRPRHHPPPPGTDDITPIRFTGGIPAAEAADGIQNPHPNGPRLLATVPLTPSEALEGACRRAAPAQPPLTLATP